MKIKNLVQLQDKLDSEIGWRVKEIYGLKFSVRNTKLMAEATLIRAGVTILYSHWEGFVKAASLAYLSYVDNQQHVYRDLKSCFVIFGLKGHIDDIRESKKSEKNIEIVEFLLNKMNHRSSMKLGSAINTESNLRSHVFENIARSLGIVPDFYKTKYNLIDHSLVDRRNSIAHGEFLNISSKEWISLSEEILTIMRAYKTDIENYASQKLYKRE